MKYTDFINSIPIADGKLSSTLTTGDVDYPGTALEVYVEDKELFDFVVNEKGELQVIVYPNNASYRLSFSLFEEMVRLVSEKVKYIPDGNIDNGTDINT